MNPCTELPQILGELGRTTGILAWFGNSKLGKVTFIEKHSFQALLGSQEYKISKVTDQSPPSYVQICFFLQSDCVILRYFKP